MYTTDPEHRELADPSAPHLWLGRPDRAMRAQKPIAIIDRLDPHRIRRQATSSMWPTPALMAPPATTCASLGTVGRRGS